MRTATALFALVFLITGLDSPARAIATLEDTLRNLPRISRIPSTWPPNSAVHRGPLGRRDIGNNAGAASSGSQAIDVGPDTNAIPNTVPAAAAPWTVALSEGQELDRDFLCAGALISQNWVLTAAHCVDAVGRRWPNDTSLHVFSHTANLAEPGRRYNAIQIVKHPQYDARSLKNDVALVKIDADENVGAPIRLEGPRPSDQVGEIVTTLGWGITTARYDQQHRERLQAIQSAVLDDDMCFSSANFPALRGTGVFCGRSLLKHHDICFRFSGSPIVVYDHVGRLYVLGLVSWPATCPSDERKPNIYLDVQAYVPWIKGVIDAGQ